MSTKKIKANIAKQKYEPTIEERSALDWFDSQRASQTVPQLKVLKDEKKATVLVDHPDQPVGWTRVMEALGTADVPFVEGLLHQLASAELDDGKVDGSGINFLLSVIKDKKPIDHIAAMLVAQMAVIHVTTMTTTRRLHHSGTLQEVDSYGAALNKLARTFATQMETLKRYQNGGESQVTVSVSNGGQAIVGNVTQAARDPKASPPALTDARMAPMPMIQNQEHAPVASPRKKEDD